MAKSSIISGMGVALSAVQALLETTYKAGGTDEDFHRALATPKGEGIREEIGRLIASISQEIYEVGVDYDKQIVTLWRDDESVLQGGLWGDGPWDQAWDYDAAQGAGLLLKGQESVEITLLSAGPFCHGLNRQDFHRSLLRQLENRGYRPANLQEARALIVFASCNRKSHPLFPARGKKLILVPGTVWEVDKVMPYLEVDENHASFQSVLTFALDKFLAEGNAKVAAVRKK